MIFVWGTRGSKRTIKTTDDLFECYSCDTDVNFRYVCYKKWVTVFWIPILRVNKEIYKECMTCDHVYTMLPEDYQFLKLK